MNNVAIPIDTAKAAINKEKSYEDEKKKRSKCQQMIHVVSLLLIAMVLSFLVVLVKAYFDGEFNSVEALQQYIAKILARKFGMPLLDELFPSGKYSKWSAWASRSRSYTAFLFLAMILPLFPDDYLCYLTGFIGIIYAFEGNTFGAVACLMVAGFCDMFDGAIASTKTRTQHVVMDVVSGILLAELSYFIAGLRSPLKVSEQSI